jgi:thiol-disulfide isomerase/thioredoxin
MWTLSDDDFDTGMRIVNPELSQGNVVVMFQRPGCPHCDIMKPHFENAEKMATTPVKFAVVDIRESRGAYEKANGPNSPFKVTGVPKTVSYVDGQYFSTYVYNPDADRSVASNYRKAGDISLYADTIGAVQPVQHANA